MPTSAPSAQAARRPPVRRSLLALVLAAAAAIGLAAGQPALAQGHPPIPHPPCTAAPIPC